MLYLIIYVYYEIINILSVRVSHYYPVTLVTKNIFIQRRSFYYNYSQVVHSIQSSMATYPLNVFDIESFLRTFPFLSFITPFFSLIFFHVVVHASFPRAPTTKAVGTEQPTSATHVELATPRNRKLPRGKRPKDAPVPTVRVASFFPKPAGIS